MVAATSTPKRGTAHSAQEGHSMNDAIAELLLRYELGDFPAPVRRRLLDIFTTDPPDAMDRLERACQHLGITSLTPGTLERASALSLQRSRTTGSE